MRAQTFLVVAASLICGCNQTGVPTGASEVRLGARGSLVAVPSGPPLATLAITRFDVQEQSGGGLYLPTVVLRETGGLSAATLQSVYLSVPGEECSFPALVVVPSGGNSTVSGPGWCFDGNLADATVSIAITFVDEAGRQGTVSGETTATRGAP